MYIKLDKMLLNYFDNSSMLSIYQKKIKKAMIERVYESHEKFIGWARPFLPSTPFTSGLISVKNRGEGGRFSHFKYFENHKSYVN